MTALIMALLGSEALLPGFTADAEAATRDAITHRLASAAIVPDAAASQFPARGIVPVHTASPSALTIPAAAITAVVVGVGVNDKGEMDVPSGASNAVGWYAPGVKPGERGTAVLDAHVFAAFQTLKQVRPGNDVYVTTEDGATLHFKVTRVATYALSEITPAMLFARSRTKDLNLITCAGTFVRSLGTFDHRLLVSATLVG